MHGLPANHTTMLRSSAYKAFPIFETNTAIQQDTSKRFLSSIASRMTAFAILNLESMAPVNVRYQQTMRLSIQCYIG